MPATTSERREAILELLTTSTLASQAELLEALEGRGHACSQPVLSRDLRALGVAKVGGAYQLMDAERVTPLSSLKSLLRSASPVPHLVQVHCEPGAASAVARALEAEDLEGLSGTLAGDDTVLVVVDSPAAGRRVRARIAELVDL